MAIKKLILCISALFLFFASVQGLAGYVNVKSYQIYIPEGYEVVENSEGQIKVLGEGMHGLVILLKDSQARLWALKYNKSKENIPSLGENLEINKVYNKLSFSDSEILLAKQWGQFGNPLEAFSVSEHPELVLKTYISGSTLLQLIENKIFLLSSQAMEMQLALLDLIERISEKHWVFKDLNPANIIYYKGAWVVIDSNPGYLVSSEEKAFEENWHTVSTKILLSNSYPAAVISRQLVCMAGYGRNVPTLKREEYFQLKNILVALYKKHFVEKQSTYPYRENEETLFENIELKEISGAEFAKAKC